MVGRCVGNRIVRRIFRDGVTAEQGEGRRLLNGPMLKDRPRPAISSGGVFRSGPARGSASKVPARPGRDASVVPPSGDQGTDRMLQILAPARAADPSRGWWV